MMADDASRDCRFCIIEAQLCVRHVNVSDEKFRIIQKSLPATPACYPIKCVVMKTHSVTQGLSSLNWENAHVGQLPNRVFMVLVDNDAYPVGVAKSTFSFKYFNASQVGVYLNG